MAGLTVGGRAPWALFLPALRLAGRRSVCEARSANSLWMIMSASCCFLESRPCHVLIGSRGVFGVVMVFLGVRNLETWVWVWDGGWAAFLFLFALVSSHV